MDVKLQIPVLSIVVPCYNEEEVLPSSSIALIDLLGRLIKKKLIASESIITFIDDGSLDGTWKVIKRIVSQHKYVHGIKLSCNKGHQNALLAGLLNVSGDVIVSIDADLQDDLNAIEDMVVAYNQGNDVGPDTVGTCHNHPAGGPRPGSAADKARISQPQPVRRAGYQTDQDPDPDPESRALADVPAG